MQINKEADFVLKGNQVVHPPVRTDGLELYYDTKGKKNTDTYKNRLLDMSGNDRHGELQNFSYKNLSGYQEDSELVFDGIDDKLVLGDVEKPKIISATRNLFNNKGLNTSKTYISGLKPNTDYTMSSNVPYDSNGRVLYLNGLATGENAVWEDKPITQRSTSGGTIWYQIYPDRNYSQELVDGEYWVQLEEGAAATPYVPYIPTAKTTYQLNNNIISYGEGETVKWVKDGEVVEVNGNMFSVYDFIRNNKENGYLNIEPSLSDGGLAYSSFNIARNHLRPKYLQGAFEEKTEYTLSFKLKFIRNEHASASYAFQFQYTDGSIGYISAVLSRQNRLMSITSDGNKTIDFITTSRQYNGDVIVYQVKVEKGSQATQWLPNSMDLLEAKELGGNILGDMEDIIDDHTRDEQSGLEVFTDKADDSLARVEVDGKSYQHAGSGKNLLKNPNSKDWKESFFGSTESVTVREINGDFIIKAIAGDGLNFGATQGDRTLSLEKGKDYTLSFEIRGDVARMSYIFMLNTEGGNTSLTTNTIVPSSQEFTRVNIPFNYTSDSPNTYLMINTQNTHGTWFEFKNVMLEEGSTATEYELPAPTPDYPIEINSLNEFDVVSSVGGRNLLVGSKETLLDVSPRQVEHNSNTYYIYGYSWHFLFNVDLKEGQTYTMSVPIFNPSETGDTQARFYVETQGNFHKRISPLEESVFSVTFTATSDVEKGNIRFLTNGTWDANVAWGYPKLEKGTKATDWAPAPEDITESDNHPLIDKINLSLSEPLRSVGDVKDRLFRDSDGLWKIERNVGEVNPYLDKGYRQLNNNTDILRFNMGASGGRISKNFNMSSSHFPISYTIGTEGINNGYSGGNGTVFIWIKSSRLSTPDISGLTQWLKSESDNGRPFIIQYERETPTIETLNQEFQDKLNNLRSFRDSNYVYTVLDN